MLRRKIKIPGLSNHMFETVDGDRILLQWPRGYDPRNKVRKAQRAFSYTVPLVVLLTAELGMVAGIGIAKFI